MRRLVYLCPSGQAIEFAMLSMDQDGASPSPRPQAAAAEDDRGDAADDGAAATSKALPCLDLAELERLAVEEALRRVDGNQGQAAVLLGITRSSLRRRLKRHGL